MGKTSSVRLKRLGETAGDVGAAPGERVRDKPRKQVPEMTEQEARGHPKNSFSCLGEPEETPVG